MSPVASARSPIRRLAAITARLLVVAVIVWGVHRTFQSAVEQLHEQGWSLRQLHTGWLLAAAACYALGQLPSGVFWFRVLRVMGQMPHLGETLRAYYIGHLGKYVPGKAMVIVLRAGLIRSQRVTGTVAAVSVFVETLTMMAVGAFVAGAIIAVLFRHQTMLLAGALAIMVAAGLPTAPPLFRRIIRLLGVARGNAGIEAQIASINYRTLLAGWCGVAGGWALTGLSLWATLRGGGYGGVQPARELLVCVAAAALAVVAGFVSLIPGGALVREAVLLELLAPTFGQAAALVAAVLARLVWLLSEVAISGILYPLGAGLRKPATAAGAPTEQTG